MYSTAEASGRYTVDVSNPLDMLADGSFPGLQDGKLNLAGYFGRSAKEIYSALLITSNIKKIDHKALFKLRMRAFRALLNEDDSIRNSWNARLAASGQRGIVTCAGTRQQMANAFVIFRMLQSYKCTLPLAIMYWGKDELDRTSLQAFKKHLPHVKFYDISERYPKHHSSLRDDVLAPDEFLGYAIKAAALYTAPFREVLLLDADSLPLHDPTDLFDVPGYLRHRNMWWSDCWVKEPGIWSLLGLSNSALNPWSKGGLREFGSPASTPMQVLQVESGQILIDRAVHWEALEWILFLNSHGGIVYKQPNMWGDKDTFRPAFALARDRSRDFYQVSHAAGWGIIDHEYETIRHPRYKFGGAIHFHPTTGSPLFHHRTAWSKFPGDAYPNKWHFITHVSPPMSAAQNSVLTATYEGWNPKFPLLSFLHFQRRDWGFYEREVQSIVCDDTDGSGREASVSPSSGSCSLSALAEADVQCCDRTMAAKERSPWPITLVRVESDPWLGRRFLEAVEAHKLFLIATGVDPPKE